VLTGNASVLLFTDGLERDDGGSLSDEAKRLRRMARSIVWLNPLLRFEGFEPRAAGIRAILPHVDAFLPAHNLNSLRDLALALSSAHSSSMRNGAHTMPQTRRSGNLSPLATN
jgi:uncharacterized protein with von Willebrand factor type A (vWA) domain